jgi:hypothetical protein
LSCKNPDLLLKKGYDFSFNDDLIYPKNKEFKSKFSISLGAGYGSLNYGSDNALSSASLLHEKLYDLPITKEHYHISKALGNYTFGLEFETRNGYLSKPITKKLGLIPLKDGSLRLNDGKEPYEFVTIPLSGYKGISTLDNVCKVLSDRTIFDQKCSLHLHLGNVPYDELFIISFMKLIISIQEELLTLFPLYKTNSELIGNSKNYCKLLPLEIKPKTISDFNRMSKLDIEEYISENFNNIYRFVSDGQTPNKDYNRRILNHPSHGQKWNIHSRKQNSAIVK